MHRSLELVLSAIRFFGGRQIAENSEKSETIERSYKLYSNLMPGNNILDPRGERRAYYYYATLDHDFTPTSTWREETV